MANFDRNNFVAVELIQNYCREAQVDKNCRDIQTETHCTIVGRVHKSE